MSNNDELILKTIIQEQHEKRFPSAKKSDFFEHYIAEQILKDFSLTEEELDSGLIGGGGDGGIDGIYLFINGELIQEDFDAKLVKRNSVIELYIIQAKRESSFREEPMNKFFATTKDLFNLNDSILNLKTVYNESLISHISLFIDIYKKNIGKYPQLKFYYYYATYGSQKEIHDNVKRKIPSIEKAVTDFSSLANFKFIFLGASDIYKLASRNPTCTYNIATKEFLSTKDSYIALVELYDLYNFLNDNDSNQIKSILFEANVRDYQGKTQINAEIQKTLQEDQKEDFWWLNNGITLVSTRAVQSDKILTITDPQIVNGQQTSIEIFNYFHTKHPQHETRCVMVRVIEATDAAIRDKIIKATNSQNSVPIASLHATDKIHRLIEVYLEKFGLYYDRRKNYQKNIGRPAEKIISIPLLAQAIMAIVLQRPDTARARPSTLLKKDEDYKKIFNDKYPIKIYLIATKITKTVQSYLRKKDELASKDKNNLIFYVAMYVAALLTQKSRPQIKDLADISFDDLSINSNQLVIALEKTRKLYEKLGATDQVAKGTLLLQEIKEELANTLGKMY